MDDEYISFKGLKPEQQAVAERLYPLLLEEMELTCLSDRLMLERAIRCYIEGMNEDETPTSRLRNTKVFGV